MTAQHNLLDTFDVKDHCEVTGHCEVCIRNTLTGEMIVLLVADNTIAALEAAKAELNRYISVCDKIINSVDPTDYGCQLDANEC